MYWDLESFVFNLFMCVDQLYLLFRVRPRIVVLLVSGMFMEPVRICNCVCDRCVRFGIFRLNRRLLSRSTSALFLGRGK